jgi:hypothetical protein
LGDPAPDPSSAAGHRHVQLDLDHGLGLGPSLERGQGVEFHPTLDRARVLRG